MTNSFYLITSQQNHPIEIIQSLRTIFKDKIFMNYCVNNLRYKKLDKDIQTIKNEKFPLSQQTPIKNKRIQIVNSVTKTCTNKNFSSIKSLIKRLQVSGNSKINFPHMRAKNQRNDIFLQGGSIDQIKNNNFITSNKAPIKSLFINRRKIQTKLSIYQQDLAYPQNQLHQVLICRNRLSQQNQAIHENCPPEKIKNQKVESLAYYSRTFCKKLGVQPIIFMSIDFKALQDENLQGQGSKNCKHAKNFVSLRPVNESGHKKTQKQDFSTRQTLQMQQNYSENNIVPISKGKRHTQAKPTSISNFDVKPQIKRQLRAVSQSQNNPSKPLFYLSQNQLKQLRITAKNFIVMEYPSKQIVTGSYFKQIGQIASLTKIVTFYCCLLIIQKFAIDIDTQILKIDQQVEFTSGTSAELLQGDKFTLRQICYGLMLPSGNDAALAMAKWGGNLVKKDGNQDDLKAFMTYMNSTCYLIGMKNSFFGNPHGLPHPKTGSTAQDVAIVITEALKIHFFQEVIKTKTFSCRIYNNGMLRQVVWQNTNKLLRRKGFTGVKTGITITAGPCLSTCYEVDNRIFITVILKATKLSRRFKQTRRIIGKVLSKLNFNLYQKQIKQILRNDAQLDSDNSQDQKQFDYQRNDVQQMKKRSKIITYQM